MKKVFIILSIIILGAEGYSSTALFAQETTESIKQHQQQAWDYLEIVPDIPLMKGLEELPNTGMIFDKPDGRIAEAFFYTNAVPLEKVNEFYLQILPQLGWIPKNISAHPRVYIRGQEQITIEARKTNSTILVHFLVSPNKL